jgi:hypothetical protein
MQSGISRLAPPEPESRLHSLPPILRNTCQIPIPSCSKGPRGLSVLPRVTSIFTRSAISPSPQLRQCPSRYAIRAGRNFVSVPCYQGDRLCLHLGSSSESPRLALRMDLPDRLDVEPHPEGISRYGATLPEERRASHGISRRLSPSPCGKAAGEGFAVMSGSSHGIAPAQGNYSPDKEFRSSASPRRRGGRTISSTPPSRRAGWRMASEDSRNRDGLR